MGYFGKVSTMNGSLATVKLEAQNIVTGNLKIPTHITDLAIGDVVMCLFISDGFQQGAIIAKMG